MGMKGETTVIEGTARDVIAELARLPGDEHVRVMVGRPSLTQMARRLQAMAAQGGMTDEIHDALLRSLKTDP
jgi:hypothetical protein